ncbi:MAG: RND transporter [Rhodothermaceae bacterium]|nr:MAG: RND transporter [Rhodothermaceae bacterium]
MKNAPMTMQQTPIHRFLASLLLAGLLGLTACSGSDEAAPPPEAQPAQAERRVVRVETQVLEPTTFTEIVELTGDIETAFDAVLSAQTASTVEALTPLGRFVRKGDVVAELDDELARAAVEQARAAVEAAQAQYDLAEDTFRRQEPLYRDSIISAIEFENVRTQRNQARAQLAQAQATLSQAEEQLQYTRITAPFAGTVEAHLVEIGEQVMPGTPVVRIVNTNQVKAVVGVPERYANDIEIGTPVEIGFKAYGMARRPHRVTFVGRVIDPQSRTFRVEIALDNPDGRLKPEMIAEVYLTRAVYEGRIVIPQTAVIRDENGVTVFVVDREGEQPVARRRTVALGPSYGGRVIVEDGLAAGDELIVVGQTKVTEGDAVEVVNRSNGLAAN